MTDKDFKKDIKNIIGIISETLIKKREDYGDNFEKTWNEFGIISAIVRLNDKINRLNNLVKNNKNPFNETIEDTFQDIIGYCLLSLRILKNERT